MAINNSPNGISHAINHDHNSSCHRPFPIVFDIFSFQMPTTVTR